MSTLEKLDELRKVWLAQVTIQGAADKWTEYVYALVEYHGSPEFKELRARSTPAGAAPDEFSGPTPTVDGALTETLNKFGQLGPQHKPLTDCARRLERLLAEMELLLRAIADTTYTNPTWVLAINTALNAARAQDTKEEGK